MEATDADTGSRVMIATGRGCHNPLVGVLMLIGAALAATCPAAAQEAWRVSAVPAVSIGDDLAGGDGVFRVRDATLAPDGRILVINGGSEEVRIYSAQGVLIETLGREGPGPGEFIFPVSFRMTADGRLMVYDVTLRRLTVFAPDGELEDTRPMRYSHGGSTAFRGRGTFRPFADGSVPLEGVDFSLQDKLRRREGLYEDKLLVHVHDGDRMQRILRRPRGPFFLVPGFDRPVPFEEGVLVGAGPRALVVGTSHDGVFQRLDQEGRVMGEYIASGTPRRVTARDWDLYRGRFRDEYATPLVIPGIGETPDRTSKVQRFLDNTPRGRLMPLFDELLLDDDGRLWVREYSLEGDLVAWQVVTQEGGTIGRVKLPRDWEVFEFGEDWVLVLVKDEFDVESVRKYRFER